MAISLFLSINKSMTKKKKKKKISTDKFSKVIIVIKPITLFMVVGISVIFLCSLLDSTFLFGFIEVKIFELDECFLFDL